ncbi:MAG: outer membrane beta-barrel protein [Alistipes sp.]|nr:outer membrane beta-barrel protein [Alistipes sp.]
MKRIIYTWLLVGAVLVGGLTRSSAQHTIGFNVGGGMASGRFEPTQETKPIWGILTGGFSWRYYTSQRVVGAVGADLEFMQRGFSIATNVNRVDDPKDYLYYTRNVNSLVLPLVWQPHTYMLKRRIRLYAEAGVTFSYNISSTYEMEKIVDGVKQTEKHDYHFSTVRDNRWGHGLVGGGGVAVLLGQYELNARVRYYFGYADILKNRNKHYDTIEGFTLTPLRSPLDNLTITIGMNYRFGKEGFEAWKPRRKREKNREVFEYSK